MGGKMISGPGQGWEGQVGHRVSMMVEKPPAPGCAWLEITLSPVFWAVGTEVSERPQLGGLVVCLFLSDLV